MVLKSEFKYNVDRLIVFFSKIALSLSKNITHKTYQTSLVIKFIDITNTMNSELIIVPSFLSRLILKFIKN